MTPPDDYYRRLRISRDANQQEVKTAFRRLARQYHPDLHPNQPGIIAKFHAIREAYEVLRDRVQRQHYDQSQQRPDKREGKTQAYRSGAYSSNAPLGQHSADEFYLRGIRSAIAHRYEDAIADYTQAIELNNQFVEAYLRRAEVRYVLGDDSGVLVDCQRAVSLHGTSHGVDSQIYYYQGMARFRLGYVESAIAAFSEAIKLDGGDARYYYQRGIAYQELHDYTEAQRDIRHSAQLYRKQGDLASYHHLQQVSKEQFPPSSDRAKRSLLAKLIRPVRFLSNSNRQNEHRGRRKTEVRGTKVRRTEVRINRRDLNALGFISILRLISNPAGELVSLYEKLGPRQTSLVGYGLAILANLCFVFGTSERLAVSSWLIASRLWVVGGLTFVTMVLAVSLAKVWLRLRGLWAADIFVLGTAIVPLGLLSVVNAVLPDLAMTMMGDRGPWLAHIGLLAATLWSFSHSVMTIQNGLCQIHPFSTKLAAWLAPVILGLGLATGVATWGFLAH
ncbi:DnaJ domain protein [Synechococcus sp. PCC 7335]|uniref:J domain-containing protein n=1 Tax=Synechococcus sp. (strain ATCC 29403 / PCC 7335) TaxID=91464 RepID=UPI00017ECA9C|nr:J domain-containing protein [Synechococcus sp. PCC 7335]EDX86533.1 DnaJ domain protein [Synechococcus sp. PCC 7335]